jgi:myo-inositol catabolism protein IolS
LILKYRRLGQTDIDVSVIAMGCWQIAGDAVWGDQDHRVSIETVHAALDAGVNFFDTAEVYSGGESEVVLGQALACRRSEAVIATKVSRTNLAAEDVRKACEGSLRRLGTDYIDLYQMHWPNPDIPLSETMEALSKLKEEGKIRAVGVSNFGTRGLPELLESYECASNQLPYNMLWRAIEYDIKPMCVENGISILCYSPLAQGLLTGKFSSPDDVPDTRARTRHFSKNRPRARHRDKGCEEETFATIKKIRENCEKIGRPMQEVALAWLLHQQGVTSVLAGARSPEQLRQNVGGAELELPVEVLGKLNDATAKLKQILGTNPDMWQSKSRIN